MNKYPLGENAAVCILPALDAVFKTSRLQQSLREIANYPEA